MSNKQKRSFRRKKNDDKLVLSRRTHIPSFNSDFVSTGTFRYCLTNAYNQQTKAFTLEMPIPPFGVTSSATNVIFPFKAIRLSKIEIWVNYMGAQNISGNCSSVTIDTRRLTKPIEYSATATNLTTGYIKKNFSVYDPVGQWYVTNSGCIVTGKQIGRAHV